MQITIDQNEIEEAIKDFVAARVQLQSNQEISVELKAGRGDHGYTATLDIQTTGIKKQNNGFTKRSTEPTREEQENPASAETENTKATPVKRGALFGNKTTTPAKVEEKEENDTDRNIPDQETPAQEEARREETEQAVLPEGEEEAASNDPEEQDSGTSNDVNDEEEEFKQEEEKPKKRPLFNFAANKKT